MEPHPLRSAVADDYAEEEARGAPYRAPEPEPVQFDAAEWQAARAEHDGAGGRMVLGWALAVLAALWIGYAAWSAGQALSGAPVTSPALAQWAAVLTGPLALMGLVWLMFGRTRRKEAERFTRSVVVMRSEASALEALLAVLSTRIDENRQALGVMSNELMGLGDEASQRLGAVTRDLESGAARLAEHGAALDRTAESARSDIGVFLSDLPQAEQRARAMAEVLRDAGQDASEQAARFEERVTALTARTGEADLAVGEAAGRLVTHLTHIESASAAARAQLDETAGAHRAEIEKLLGSAANGLEAIRHGIDTQAAAVNALVEQSSAALGTAGQEAADALTAKLADARAAIDGLSTRIAEQDRTSQRLIAELDAGLAALDDRFLALTQDGHERSGMMLAALGRVRSELGTLAESAGGQDAMVDQLAGRTQALREAVEQLTAQVRDGLGQALDHAEDGAARLSGQAEAALPAVEQVRDAAIEASERLTAGAQAVETQHDRLADLLTAIDTGMGLAENRLGELGAAIGMASQDATRLTQETGPALVAAMVQVREAATHACERAREAIGNVIPDAAGSLSTAAREALTAAVQETVAEQLREVQRVAAQALDAAHGASERLTRQMLTIGQSASALEAHIHRTEVSHRQHDSDEFAKRVALLIDSMHSAAIDVGKILADELDEKAWTSYLKGNRGIFTRRAARLLGSGETKAIAAHYEADPEFEAAANRYTADFEAMLRRVLAERDGGMIAVTLMSSDVGKLYAALSPVVERRK